MKLDWKKILWWIFIIFIIYSIFTSPEQSAGVVRAIIDIILNGFRALGTFVSSVLGGW